MSPLSPAENDGGLLAMGLLEATLGHDHEAVAVLYAAALGQPAPVIKALTSALATYLRITLGGVEATRLVMVWRAALLEEASCSGS